MYILLRQDIEKDYQGNSLAALHAKRIQRPGRWAWLEKGRFWDDWVQQATAGQIPKGREEADAVNTWTLKAQKRKVIPVPE